MRLYPKSSENPHPIKNGTRVDTKFCSHLEIPKYEKTRKVCKSKIPCLHSFRWVVGAWPKVSRRFSLFQLSFLSTLFTVFEWMRNWLRNQKRHLFKWSRRGNQRKRLYRASSHKLQTVRKQRPLSLA